MEHKKIILSVVALLLALGIMVYYYLDKEKATIAVQTNGGVPYEWQYELSKDDIISVKETSKEHNKNVAGGVVDIKYIITPLKEGTTMMELKYINITDNSIDKMKKYRIKVDKYMHLSIVEVKK